MRVPATLAGKAVRCPQCKNPVRVVADAPEPPPAPVAALPDLPPSPPPPVPAEEDVPFAQEVGTVHVTSALPEPAPAALPEAEAEEPPRPRRRSHGRAFRPIKFDLRVERDPDRQLRGRFTGRISCDGLRLLGTLDQDHELPVGTRARYLGGDRFRVEMDGRQVELRVTEAGLVAPRFTRDLVAFLNGERETLDRADYQPSKLPCLLAALPLLVPALGCGLWLSGVFGAVVWSLLGLVLCGASLAVLAAARRSLAARLTIVGVLTVLGLVLVPVLHFGFQAVAEAVSPSANWQTYTAPDGRWSVLMPGKVRTGTEFVPNVTNNMDKHESRVGWNKAEFFVGTLDLTQAEWAKMSLPQFFTGFGDGLLKKDSQFRMVDTKPVRLHGKYSGRQYDLTHPKYGKVRFIVYAVQPTFYVVGAQWQSGMPEEEVERFFASFQLAGVAPGAGGPAPGPGPDPGPKPGQGKQPPPDPSLTPPDQRGAPPWEPLPSAPLDADPLAASELPGLVGYWPLDEGMGTVIVDRTGKNPNAKLVGGWWVEGVRGKAVLFDGKQDYINLGTAAPLNVADGAAFSVALWVATREGEGGIFSQRSSESANPVLDLMVNGGNLVVYVRADGLEFGEIRLTSPAVNDGRWHHVAVTRNGAGLVSVYVDGKRSAQGSSGNTKGSITTNMRTLGVERYWATQGGNAPGRSYFSGAVDELSIFDRELTPGEIKRLAGRN
jgi:hypothetical protein